MDEKDMLKEDIERLKNAYDKLQKALNKLKDVDGLNEQYNELYCIAEDINDRRIKLEVRLEILEEVA